MTTGGRKRSAATSPSAGDATPVPTTGKTTERPATKAQSLPIVAIGASAGGLEALEQFFKNVPVGCGMAFVVIQHLDPDRIGMLPELLQRVSVMPVQQARNQGKLRPDHVYVIPPNRDLSILDGKLLLLEPEAPRGLRLPIDFFFRALAESQREQAIGVVLSGMGSDGSLGARALKEHGGFCLAQDPADARFDGMPRSVIATGLVDVVDRAAELPARIVAYVGRVPTGIAMDVSAETVAHANGFQKICLLLRTRTGHDFSQYKRSTVYRRVERRMVIHSLDRIGDYVTYLRENPQEVELLFKELLIGVTSFFRDPNIWAALQEQALPRLLAAHARGGALRAWVAGCSTGEEAYSLAIALREAQDELPPGQRCSLQIFATDLDPDAISRARLGYYRANVVADISEARLKRFFVDDGDGFRVTKEIRETVVFATQNLIMDPPFTKLDLLSCRNVLIYLGAELQKRLLPLFHYSLKPGGVLMLGSAESISGHGELFEALDARMRLFRRRENSQQALGLHFPTPYARTTAETAMTSKTEDPAFNLKGAADQLLLQQFSPAAVLVNADGDLVYVSGRTGRYLEAPAGKVNWNIHAMAFDGLRQEIAIALPRALRSGEPISCRNIRIEGEAKGTFRHVDLTVQPIREPVGLSGMAMLVFGDAVVAATATPATGKKRGTHASEREAALDKALAEALQEAQVIREEMQTAQEELKSANEELQSTNEELQSTNEELTTSREELQSLNEELQTVNAELQSKVDNLSSANNDMKNLLNSTDIATVFLDSALNVRRFTEQSTKLFKLIPGDVGRPLSDIVTDLDYADLSADALTVLRTLAVSEREITTDDDRWYEVRILPYRTLENVIDGVVITFTDISRAKQLEAQLRAGRGSAQ